jgi:alpha-L-fucosidase
VGRHYTPFGEVKCRNPAAIRRTTPRKKSDRYPSSGSRVKTDQPWIGETPVGDWFYAPNFTYDSGMMIHYITEAASRDGNAAIWISLLPDGSLDNAA